MSNSFKNKKILLFLLLIAQSPLVSCNKKENVNIIILAGQSNAMGWSNIDEAKTQLGQEKFNDYSIQSNNIYIHFQNWGNELLPEILNSNDNFETIKFGQGMTKSRFGPEIGVSKVLRVRKEKYFIIKYAKNSADIAETWNINSDTHKSFISFVKSSYETLKKDYNPTFKAFFWMQGENDSIEERKETVKDYKNNLKNLFNNIKSETQNDNLLILDAGISDGEDWTYYKEINEQKKQLDEEIKNHYYFSTIDLGLKIGTEDPWHYDAKSMITLGETFANKYIEYTK